MNCYSLIFKKSFYLTSRSTNTASQWAHNFDEFRWSTRARCFKLAKASWMITALRSNQIATICWIIHGVKTSTLALVVQFAQVVALLILTPHAFARTTVELKFRCGPAVDIWTKCSIINSVWCWLRKLTSGTIEIWRTWTRAIGISDSTIEASWITDAHHIYDELA